MARRPSPTRLGILRAMLSRDAPLILMPDGRTGFVRDWGSPPIPRRDAEALVTGGWLRPDPIRRRVFVLSDAGRALAAEAAAKAHPPTRAEEIAA